MKKIELTINGKAYPCRMTMGAMLRFKREAGKDVSEIKGEVADMAVLLWCCVVSACKADGVEFGLSLEDFADSVDPATLNEWQTAIFAAAGAGEDGQKKSV